MTAAENRPKAGALVIPYVVDETRDPIDFKALDDAHVDRCANHRRCGVCGTLIPKGTPLAFVGPDDGRTCFADPWMHLACAALAMQQCPFLRGSRGWRDRTEPGMPLIAGYQRGMVLRVAPSGRAHRDPLGAWHFEAVGPLTEAAS